MQSAIRIVFSAENFILYPMMEAFEALEKSELLMLGKYLNLEVKNAMLKFEIRNVIVTRLVDEEILDEVALDLVKTFGVDTVRRV